MITSHIGGCHQAFLMGICQGGEGCLRGLGVLFPARTVTGSSSLMQLDSLADCSRWLFCRAQLYVCPVSFLQNIGSAGSIPLLLEEKEVGKVCAQNQKASDLRDGLWIKLFTSPMPLQKGTSQRRRRYQVIWSGSGTDNGEWQSRRHSSSTVGRSLRICGVLALQCGHASSWVSCASGRYTTRLEWPTAGQRISREFENEACG